MALTLKQSLTKDSTVPIRGERLRELREKEKLSQEELAKIVKLAESRIWTFENDPENNPRLDNVIKLAELFKVSTDYLIGRSGYSAVATSGELSAHEAAALDAWRRGDRMEAVRIIAQED